MMPYFKTSVAVDLGRLRQKLQRQGAECGVFFVRRNDEGGRLNAAGVCPCESRGTIYVAEE